MPRVGAARVTTLCMCTVQRRPLQGDPRCHLPPAPVATDGPGPPSQQGTRPGSEGRARGARADSDNAL
eukprot:8648396-Alexandrium_andersonii.AAC.1